MNLMSTVRKAVVGTGRPEPKLTGDEYRALRAETRLLMAQGWHGRQDAKKHLRDLLVEDKLGWNDFKNLSNELALDRF